MNTPDLNPALYQPYQKGACWAFDCETVICGRKMRATSDGFLFQGDAARAAKAHQLQEQAKSATQPVVPAWKAPFSMASTPSTAALYTPHGHMAF